MQRDQGFCVIGHRVNGHRVVITKDTERKTAERIVSLMTAGSTFGELLIEADGDGETPSVGCGVSVCADPSPAGFTHRK
jgi:hypothetical protein